MRKFLIIIPIIICILYILNLFWKWNYVNNAGNTIQVNLIWNKIQLESDYWIYNSALKISYINMEIDNNKNIYVRLYSKFYKLSNPIYKDINNVELKEKWKYKVYYKNSDWSLDFIKEIENK